MEERNWFSRNLGSTSWSVLVILSINKTHVVMAGGYRGHYVLTDDFGRQITFGGRSLDRVWMFDGAYWEEMAPMDTVRDRPACSLFSGAEGRIKVNLTNRPI